jgi:Flp pilus assembly protein TadD
VELAQYEAALPILEEALRQVSSADGRDTAESISIRTKQAWALYHLRRYRDAESAFDRAVQASPDRPELLAGLGWCYLQLGRAAEARTAFQRALALQPGNRDAVEGLRRAGG